MLSYISMYPSDWQAHSYVACCGTSIQPVLDRLCEYGYLAAKPLPPAHGVGRKPSEIYLTNPAVLEDGTGEGRS